MRGVVHFCFVFVVSAAQQPHREIRSEHVRLNAKASFGTSVRVPDAESSISFVRKRRKIARNAPMNPKVQGNTPIPLDNSLLCRWTTSWRTQKRTSHTINEIEIVARQQSEGGEEQQKKKHAHSFVDRREKKRKAA